MSQPEREKVGSETLKVSNPVKFKLTFNKYIVGNFRLLGSVILNN